MIVPKPRRKTFPAGVRIGGAAVRRNRLKRQLREIARTGLLPLLAERGCALDILVRVRPDAFIASFQDLRTELVECVEGICSSGS
jgi:ribonuclease P protein component